MTPAEKLKMVLSSLDAIAAWGALIDDEPESRRIARNLLHEFGLAPEGYVHETDDEWHARRRREYKWSGTKPITKAKRKKREAELRQTAVSYARAPKNNLKPEWVSLLLAAQRLSL